MKNKDTEFKYNIRIADEVIGYIAVLSAADVEGVAGIAGFQIKDLKSVFSGKNASKKKLITEVEGDNVTLSLEICGQYGSNLQEVCHNLQDKIKTTIENMTGLNVIEVNISVSGIAVPDNM